MWHNVTAHHFIINNVLIHTCWQTVCSVPPDITFNFWQRRPESYLLTMVGMHSPIHHCTALCLDSISTAALLLLCCFALWAFCVFRLVLTVNYILFYCFCCIITSPVRAQGVEIYSRSCLIRTFCIHCCLSMSMDDWKLKTTPVVRLQRPSKTFVYFLCFFATLRYVTRISWILLTY